MSVPKIMLRTNLEFLHFIEKYITEHEAGKISIKHLAPKTRFINQGEKIRDIFIIKEGITKCFISEENGKDFIIEFLGKGEVVGELEALKDISCLCNVESISDVTVYAVPKDLFLQLIAENNHFTNILLQELSTRIIQTSSRASFQQSYTLAFGLPKLLQLQQEANFEISKEDMAAYLGISIRSFNRTLKLLMEKKGKH
ncbi:Crp/Fnr family transcriptional regulator [Pedobacter sandarakinus]|uniref:Crp/Fnr family transcriptional regulator n=1 Tax=Pedobacter sandarakinus TaxID=353156 RepID=UPI0022463AAF|nr:Crp/Fnr family transcriptional regulator [Pedobacter sandarakinus]MCX2573045.1 Crp/Fnr family transcriptional regulator [Pedobacter sandarakinus]